MVCSQPRSRWLLAVACMALFCALDVRSASASIMLPNEVPVDLEALLSDTATSAQPTDDSSHPSGRRSPVEQTQDQRLTAKSALVDSPTGSSSSTSGSTTGSSSGHGNGGQSPFHTLSAATAPDLLLVGWNQGEARFSLPEPPGNELLRPPQC